MRPATSANVLAIYQNCPDKGEMVTLATRNGIDQGDVTTHHGALADERRTPRKRLASDEGRDCGNLRNKYLRHRKLHQSLTLSVASRLRLNVMIRCD
jgi:hypothetical protein